MLSYVTKNKHIINIKRAVAVLSVIALFCSFNNVYALTYNDREIINYNQYNKDRDEKGKIISVIPYIKYDYISDDKIYNYKDIIFNENSAYSNTERISKDKYKVYTRSKYYKTQIGEIKKILTATTTLENWTLNRKISLREKLINNAYAESYYTQNDNSIYAQNANWTSCQTATSGTLDTPGKTYIAAQLGYYINRGFESFDTSALEDDLIIDTAKFYFKLDYKDSTKTYAMYKSSGAFSIPLHGNDFDLCNDNTIISDTIDADSMTASNWYYFTLNGTGTSTISLTGVSNMCIRDKEYDVANSAPSGTYYIRFLDSTNSGTADDPYLLITIATTTESTTTETISTSTTTMIDMTNVTFLLTGILIWIIMMTGIFFYKQTK